jgi:hypothetical protein
VWMHGQLVLVVVDLGLAPVARADSASADSPSNSAGATTDARQAAQGLTPLLLDAQTRYAAAAPADRGQRLAELLAVARQRHDDLAALVGTDPAAVLQVAPPDGLHAGPSPGRSCGPALVVRR